MSKRRKYTDEEPQPEEAPPSLWDLLPNDTRILVLDQLNRPKRGLVHYSTREGWSIDDSIRAFEVQWQQFLGFSHLREFHEFRRGLPLVWAHAGLLRTRRGENLPPDVLFLEIAAIMEPRLHAAEQAGVVGYVLWPDDMRDSIPLWFDRRNFMKYYFTRVDLFEGRHGLDVFVDSDVKIKGTIWNIVNRVNVLSGDPVKKIRVADYLREWPSFDPHGKQVKAFISPVTPDKIGPAAVLGMESSRQAGALRRTAWMVRALAMNRLPNVSEFPGGPQWLAMIARVRERYSPVMSDELLMQDSIRLEYLLVLLLEELVKRGITGSVMKRYLESETDAEESRLGPRLRIGVAALELESETTTGSDQGFSFYDHRVVMLHVLNVQFGFYEDLTQIGALSTTQEDFDLLNRATYWRDVSLSDQEWLEFMLAHLPSLEQIQEILDETAYDNLWHYFTADVDSVQ